MSLLRGARSCACRLPPTPRKGAKRVVTLVHGTYAQHGPWLQDGQNLPVALSKVEGTVLARFCWSGKNRHRDRLEAGDALRRHLVVQISAYREVGANATHHVVAHSHGGNVALYALRDRGDEDDAIIAGVKLITLATPFLAMRERVLPRYLFIMLPIPLLLAVGVLAGFEMTSSGEVTRTSSILRLRTPLSLGLAIGGIAPAVTYLLSLLLYRLRPASPPLWPLVSGKAARHEAALITAHALKPPERLLVVGALSDEAAGLLGAAQLTNRAMARLAGELRFSNIVPKVLVVLIFAFISTSMLLPQQSAESIVSAVFWGIVSILVAGPPLVVSFLVLANLPFGLDTLFWNLNAETTAAAAPLGASEVVVVGWRQVHYERASHRIYDNLEAQQKIIARLKARG